MCFIVLWCGPMSRSMMFIGWRSCSRNGSSWCCKKLAKVMLFSTSWSAEKHTFTFPLQGIPSVILRKVPCMALGTTRPGSLPLACLKTTGHGVLLVIRFLKSWRLLTVKLWVTGTFPRIKSKNFFEPTLERLREPHLKESKYGSSTSGIFCFSSRAVSC